MQSTWANYVKKSDYDFLRALARTFMYYTYVLRSKKDKRLYTGSTGDLRKRFNEHNTGQNFSTKSRRPFVLWYYEACWSKVDAEAREKFLKSGPGKRYLTNRLKRTLRLTGFAPLTGSP